MTDDANMMALRDFRNWAYRQNTQFGKNIDALILDGAGLGATVSLTDILSKLENGLKSAAESAQLGYQQYLDAMTKTKLMQDANKAGVPVDVYLKTAAGQNAVAALISNPNSPIPSVFGVPIWLVLGGLVVYLVVSR